MHHLRITFSTKRLMSHFKNSGDSSMLITRGERDWGEEKEDKGGQIYGDGRLWVVSTQCDIQVI